MLEDPEEIKIISYARQKNVREPNRSRKHFENIFKDFFTEDHFLNKSILDIGPGQYDFGVLARKLGASIYGIDNDDAVIKLGRYKQFSVVSSRIQDISYDLFNLKFDGVFCKFSLNAFWYLDSDKKHQEFLENIISLLKPEGWVWIAPWNGIPSKEISNERLNEILGIQASIFTSVGINGINLTHELSRYYGVHGNVANNALYLKNTKCPYSLKDCSKLN